MSYSAVLRACFALVVVVLFQARASHAQNDALEPASAFWLDAGLGVGTLPHESAAAAVRLSVGYERAANVFSVRTVFTGEPVFGGYVYDVGVLYGRAFSSGPHTVSLGTGLAVVAGKVGGGLCIAVGYAGGCSDDFVPTEEIDATVGLPLEAQYYYSSSSVGVGLAGFANLNADAQFAGVVLSLRLGRLR